MDNKTLDLFTLTLIFLGIILFIYGTIVKVFPAQMVGFCGIIIFSLIFIVFGNEKNDEIKNKEVELR